MSRHVYPGMQWELRLDCCSRRGWPRGSRPGPGPAHAQRLLNPLQAAATYPSGKPRSIHGPGRMGGAQRRGRGRRGPV